MLAKLFEENSLLSLNQYNQPVKVSAYYVVVNPNPLQAFYRHPN